MYRSLLLGCLCAARVLLKVRASLGCNRSDFVQDGTHPQTDTHTHGNTFVPQREYLEMRLLLLHGCHNLQSLEEGAMLYAYIHSSTQHSKNKEAEIGSHFVSSPYCLLEDPWMTHTLTNTCRSRSTVHVCHTVKHREGLEARLLLYRGCVQDYSVLRAVVLVADTGTQQHSEKQINAFWGFPWAWSALPWRKAIPWLLARFCDVERPEHSPRSPAGTYTCIVVYRRASRVPRSREHEKRPAGGREKYGDVLKKSVWYIAIYMYVWPIMVSYEAAEGRVRRYHTTCGYCNNVIGFRTVRTFCTARVAAPLGLNGDACPTRAYGKLSRV